MTEAEMLAVRAKAFDGMQALAALDTLSDDEDVQFKSFKTEINSINSQLDRRKEAQAMALKTAKPVGAKTVHATVETDPYVKDPTLVMGGMAKMLGASRIDGKSVGELSSAMYGENHPITKALFTGSGSAGGFLVPPDIAPGVIELIRAKSVVREAGPLVIPMPRGTMTMPGQASAETASYGAEGKAIQASQPSFNKIVATYKKLTAKVPVSNDMVRYADPAIDGIVRNSIVRTLALRQDLAFLLGDGTQDAPRGFVSFANGWVAAKGGTVGVFSQSANSVLAVNASDPPNSTGGNFITSNPAYVLATAVQELGGAMNRLDTANVPDEKRVWFMHPRSRNYLNNVQNSLGIYVFRDELSKGTLNNYPVKVTTQIGNGFWDATGTNKDLSFIFLVEMTESMIFDSMQLQLAVSTEASYIDTTGTLVSAFDRDEMVIRAIAEHDHQMRHDFSVAVIQGVRWAPAIL